MTNVKQITIVATIAVLVGIGGIIGSTPRVQATQDAYTRGQADAYRDYNGMNGHGYDASCPSGHSDSYCVNYNQGYNDAWDRLSNNNDNNNSPRTIPIDSGNDQSNAQGQSSNVNIHGNNNHVNVEQNAASSQKSHFSLGKAIIGTLDALANSPNEDPYYQHHHSYN